MFGAPKQRDWGNFCGLEPLVGLGIALFRLRSSASVGSIKISSIPPRLFFFFSFLTQMSYSRQSLESRGGYFNVCPGL